jgi:hypothetical protein
MGTATAAVGEDSHAREGGRQVVVITPGTRSGRLRPPGDRRASPRAGSDPGGVPAARTPLIRRAGPPRRGRLPATGAKNLQAPRPGAPSSWGAPIPRGRAHPVPRPDHPPTEVRHAASFPGAYDGPWLGSPRGRRGVPAGGRTRVLPDPGLSIEPSEAREKAVRPLPGRARLRGRCDPHRPRRAGRRAPYGRPPPTARRHPAARPVAREPVPPLSHRRRVSAADTAHAARAADAVSHPGRLRGRAGRVRPAVRPATRRPRNLQEPS